MTFLMIHFTVFAAVLFLAAVLAMVCCRPQHGTPSR